MKPKEKPYEIMMTYTDTQQIIKHCDKKIEMFFKRIDKVVKAEVRRIMKVKK